MPMIPSGVAAPEPTMDVGIVDPEHPLTARTVQSKGIIDAVRSFPRRRNLMGREFHPVSARRIDNQYLPVEIEQCL
jgi:hypothetical protein